MTTHTPPPGEEFSPSHAVLQSLTGGGVRIIVERPLFPLEFPPSVGVEVLEGESLAAYRTPEREVRVLEAAAEVKRMYEEEGFADHYLATEDRGRILVAFLRGLTRIELNHPTAGFSADLLPGWSVGLPPAEVDKFVLHVETRGLGFVYFELLLGHRPPGWGRVAGGRFPVAEHHLRSLSPIRAKRREGGELFDPTEERVEELTRLVTDKERALAREVLEEGATFAGAYQELTPGERALHKYLLERFGAEHYRRRSLEFTPGELLAGLGWEEAGSKYQELEDAVDRLRLVFRPRAYRYKGDKKGRMEAHTNVSPWWDVAKVHASGEARVVRYKFTPAEDLFFQVNPDHGGRPAFYRWEPRGYFPSLVRRTGSTTKAAEVDALRDTLRTDLLHHIKEAGGEEVLEYEYAHFALLWVTPPKGRKPRPERSAEERLQRHRIRELVKAGMGDHEIARELGVEYKEAKNLRERAGLSLRQEKKPLRTSQVRKRLEEHLELLKNEDPAFVLGYELPKGSVFRVRVKRLE